MSIEKSSELFIPAPAIDRVPTPKIHVSVGMTALRDGRMPIGGGFVEITDGEGAGIGAINYVDVCTLDPKAGTAEVTGLPKGFVSGPENEHKMVRVPNGDIVFWNLVQGYMQTLGRVDKDTGFRPRSLGDSVALPNGNRQVLYRFDQTRRYNITNVSITGNVTVALPRRYY